MKVLQKDIWWSQWYWDHSKSPCEKKSAGGSWLLPCHLLRSMAIVKRVWMKLRDAEQRGSWQGRRWEKETTPVFPPPYHPMDLQFNELKRWLGTGQWRMCHCWVDKNGLSTKYGVIVTTQIPVRSENLIVYNGKFEPPLQNRHTHTLGWL